MSIVIRAAVIAIVMLAASAAVAAPSVVRGTVSHASARWDQGAIVTEAVVDGADGSVTVVQLGGVVDGIGESYSHLPAPLAVGDHVTLEVEVARTATGAVSRVVRSRTATGSSVLPAGGTAAYGVQRTKETRTPLWRAAGCLDVVHDASTISPANAAVIDAAFAAWSDATTTCGALSVTSRSEPVGSSTDAINAVVMRTDRWCRPASATMPEICYPPEAMAVTRLRFVDDTFDSDDGKILEADMEINAVQFAFGPSSAAGRIVVDLQSVVTHEAGHVLGLAHDCGTGREPWPTDLDGVAVPSCDARAPTPQSATMFYAVAPGDTSARSLEPSDVRGACSLMRGATCERAIEGGCSATGDGPSGWWILAVGSVLALRRRR